MADEIVPAWKVTGQAPSYATIDGKPMQVMVVTFVTAGGVTDSVSIPSPDYTAENVAAAITAKADTINAVHGLQGPPT